MAVLQMGAYEAKTRWSELLAAVQQGNEVTITKHGHPMARLTPVKKVSTPDSRRAATARMRDIAKGLTLGGLSIRQLRDEGCA